MTKHQSMPGRRKAVTQSSTTARRSRTAEAIRKQVKLWQQGSFARQEVHGIHERMQDAERV